MTAATTELAVLAGPWLWAALAVMLRVGPVIALAPVFGEQVLSARLRLGLALAMSLVLLPMNMPRLQAPDALADRLAFAAAEVLAGLIFGIGLRLLVLALMTAGSIIAQSISLAQIAGGGVAAEPAPAIGHLLVFGGLALAATAGLHLKLAAYLQASYDLLPAGRFPTPETVMTAGLGATGHSLSLAFALAMPFVIGALLYNLLMGVINRAMPQMMVSFVGAPLLVAASLALLVIAVPLLLSLWAGALDRFLALPFAAPP